MKILKWIRVVMPAVVVLTGLYCTSAYGALPAGNFACQVRAEGGKRGLVLIQSDTMKQAADVALRAQARTMDGGHSKTIAVLECIDFRAGRFKDTQFQSFFESLPN